MAIVVHLLLFWILSAVTSYSDEDSCPKRSKIDQDGLHCYWISASASTWLEARDLCQRWKGGDIAVVDKPSVQDFIDKSFQLEAPAVVWLRNEIRTGQHHGFGPPISQHEDREKGTCSQMVLGLKQWRNSPCNKEHHFICGKEISVSLPSMDSYVIGVPLMSGTYTQSQFPALPSPPDLGQQRVEMMLFPGLWFSHGGQVVSLDLVSQPSQVLTMARVQILRPYCSPTHYLVPPGCSSLLNPFSCCSEEPMCNTTGVCISGLYWCHLLESCLPVTSPCSPYHSSAAGLVFPLPPRYTAVPPFYHMMADVSLKILPASEPVHLRVTFEEKGISVYPDDIIAVQHSRKAGEFLHCVSSLNSAWRQSYLYLPGPELGGWVEVGVSVPTDGGQWVDNVVCDLQLIYEDSMLVYGVPPVLSSTQSDLRIETTTPTTHLVKPQTPVSGLHVLYPVLDKENQIHLPVNVRTIIIVKILSGHNATSAWSAPVFRTGIPFQLSCPPDMSEIQAVCERDTPDVWFSYIYIKLSAQGEQTLNITASNTLNTQMLSVKLQAHIPVTGLNVQPQGFHRVLVDIPQGFTAAVATGSSVKYTWITDNLVQFVYTGQTYNVVFKKQGEYMLKVMAENPVSSQFLEVKLTADVMAPLANLTVLSKKEAIAMSTPNIYTLRVKLDISIGVTIRWDFGDSSTCVNHTFSAPLERSNTSLDQTAIQIYLQDSVLHTYTTPGDYTLRIEAENKYDHIKKVVPIKVRSPLTRVLISSMPTVPNVNQSILFEASSLPSSYGILYLWNFGDGSQELKGPYKVSHAFKAAGVYNVSVCSNNTLSQIIAWMSLEVVETISGVHLSYNGPSELNSVTEIYGRVSTGTSLRWTFELGDGSVFKDLSKSSISHIYKSVGNYTAQVTVSNAVSKVRQSINVEIYQLAINGIWPSGCIVSGEEVILQAVVTGNVSSLTFHWSFGDGTLLSVKTGTSTIAHTFSGPRNYLIDLKVYSHVGSVHYQATVCVEALITDLKLHSALNAVAVDEEICFDALVRPSGEMYQFLWYNSSSSDSPVSGKSHHCFFFALEGMHEIMLITHNHVSRKTAKATIFVQRPVLKLSIKHEDNSDMLTVNQSYSFWTEPYQNNGVVEWDFGDGSQMKEGQNQSHTFTSAGRFHVTASVFNAVSQQFVEADVEVQVPISNIVIHTNQPYAEVGQETVFTALCNVVDNVKYFWRVDPLFPSKLGTSEYRYVFPRAGIFEVKVMAQNFVSKMETSASIEVVERIQGVQITNQILKSMRYIPTKETITLTAFVKNGSNLTYNWLIHQDGFNRTVGDGEHFKLFTNNSGNVSVKLTVANVLGREHKDVTLRAVECVSGVNISTPAYVIAKGKPVKITVSVKTGTDLQYIWFLDSDYSPVTTDVPFVLHVFKAIGIFKLRVSVANVLGSVDSTKQLTVQEDISEIDFKVDGKSHPFFVTSNSLLQLHGSVRKGNDLHWVWTVALQGRNVISLGNNQTVSYSFMDVGGHCVTLNASNDISCQSVSHIVTVEDTIQGLNLRVSEMLICENDAVTFTPAISQGSGVSFLLEFAGGNSSLRVLENFTISSLPIGNHTVKAIAENHVSTLSATVAVQVVERVRGLHFCCTTVLEALIPSSFKASVITGSQVTYQWSFQLNGFNTSQETGQNVLYTPFINGSLSVTVKASNAAFCSQSVTETVVVQWPVKKVTLLNSPDGPFIDHPVTFFALADSGSDLMFQWDFGDSDDVVKITKSNTVDHKYKVKGRFVVHVTVFNNVSQVSAQLAVVVSKLECTQPRVSLIQDQPKILKATPNYFEASVELSGCVSYKTTYLWEIYHDPNCTEKKVSLDSSVDVAIPLLYLPKQILEVGDYCLKFSARFQSTPLHHQQTTKISVVYSPLVPIIKGGSHRMWSSQNDLILDGTESYDPDSAAHDDLLQLQWDFKVLQDSTTSHSSRSFFPDQIIQHNSSFLILPRHILEPGSVYQFTLTVKKDGRPSVSTKQYVKMYEEEIIPVAVKCVSCSLHFSSYVSHSHPIALAGHCALCNGTVKFKWTAENSLGDVLHLNEVTTTTGDRAPILVIRPDVLMAGSEYIFTLNISQSITGLWGSASIDLKLNHPPQGGSCTLSPDHSVQLLQDMVSFSCSGWLDEDRECAQMIYSLQVAQCEDPGPQCPLITLYRGTQHTFRTLVPLGSARMRDNASIITIIVQVEDDMGAKVTALRRNLEVVLPVNDQGTTEWLKKKSQSELPALLQQGNPQDVIQYSTALISQLNQLEAMSGLDFEDRMQMRGNVTQALASLSVSSLQDAAQISSALAHSTAVPSELQCGDCHSRVVETTQKMIKVIREQTKQGDVTPIDTGRNILSVLSNSMTAAQKSKDILGANYHYKHQDTSETAVSALQQVGELMRSLMWSRMPGEEALSLKAPQISAVGIRGDPASNLLCTEESSHCQFYIPPALSSKLSKERKEVLQVLLVMKTERHPFVAAADPPISTTLAAMEFGTPQGQPITIANLTSDSAIHVTLHKQDMDMSPRVNVTLPSEGSVNFIVKAVEMYHNAGLFITFNFSLFQGSDQINSGRVNVSVSYQQGLPLSQHSLNLSLSTDVPSVEDTIFLTPLLNGSSRELYVTLNSSLSGAEVCVSVCVFSSLCQFFNVEQRRWSTDGLNVLSSSSPNTADCLTQHLTLFGASLFIHPDAILLLPPSDGPVRNVVVGIVCGVLLLIHLLVGLIAHKLDHLENLRLSCIPLCGQAGRYYYRVLIKTGWQRGAGTSAHVGIRLYGLNKSGSRHLQKEGAFQRNGLDDFQVETDANLGEIWKICIWHDNTGLDPSWYLQHVVVWDMQMDNMFFFVVDDWLSVENEKNSGMVQKVVLATCPQELQQFGRMLRAQLLFGLREHHLWLSLWERPAHSSFSRAQRVTSCALLLHLYLAAGAVWYGAVSTKSGSRPVADQMSMNPETILVGMTVAVVIFPLQSLLTSLFSLTKSKVVMELSLPPSPVSDTVEMDVYLSHPDFSYSSFLSMPRGPESSTYERPSPFTESMGSLKLQSEFLGPSNMGNGSSVDQWTSNDSIFGLPELMGPTRLLKRKRALLQLRLVTPTSDIANLEPSSSPHLSKQPPSLSEGEMRSASADPFLPSNASSGPTTSDSGRYSPNETSVSDFQDRSCSEWSELSEHKPMYEGGLYKSPSSVSVCSVASTFLPSLPPDSCSIVSNTRIGVARSEPGVMLPSWVLAVVYLLVAVLLGTCLSIVGLYGSKFSSSVVLMWLTSVLSAFFTSALLLEPLKICVRALYLAAVVKPVDPEVEDRLAQETAVRRMAEKQGTKVRPPCGYGLLQAKEEARKVRMVQALMRNCLVYMMFLLVVLMVNYQDNIQEMNSRLLHSSVKRSIISASSGQPNLTALSGWKEAWQWMNQSLMTHLHQSVSFSLIGSSRLKRVQSKNFCGGNTEDILKHEQSLEMFTTSVLSHSNSPQPRRKTQSNNTSLLNWSWSKAQSCMFSQTEEILLGNSSVSTSHTMSGLQTAHWITAETQAVLVEFTQYHRETGLFLPVSILLENAQAHRILSTISIQSFHIPGSHSGLDFTIALTALLLLFSVCILSTELWAMLREGVQYLRQGWHLLQLLLALLSLATASLRLCFLSKANSCLSSHLSQPDAFTDFHGAALLAKRSSQLSAVLLTLLVLQMVGALRFVRRWVVFGAVLQQACSEMCGVFLLFILLLLLFSHTGCVLFSGSVEGFRTIWQTNQSLLALLRGRRVLHELCERHPVLGPLYCLSTFGVGFWLLGRLCGAVLVHTYRTFQAEMYRPSMEPQDYEMVEFLIKRLKLWMGLSKAKEFRHRVKFEGMESPPSRSSRCSQFSSLSVANSPISPSISSSPAGLRLISSASSLASECSTLSDSPDLQQYVDRLLPSVDSLLAGFDRVNQLTDDVLNIELQLQKASCRIAEKRKKHKDPQPQPQNLKSEVSQLDESPQHMELKPPLSSQQGIHRILARRRGTHSESSIMGPITHVNAHPGNQSWQQGQTGAELDIRNLPRLRAWNSGSCHSADVIQRSPKTQNPAAILVRPRSEEGDRSERSKGMPIKRRAWHPEDSL